MKLREVRVNIFIDLGLLGSETVFSVNNDRIHSLELLGEKNVVRMVCDTRREKFRSVVIPLSNIVFMVEDTASAAEEAGDEEARNSALNGTVPVVADGDGEKQQLAALPQVRAGRGRRKNRG